MNSSLLFVGAAALLISCVMLPLRVRARAAVFAIILASVLNVATSTTVAKPQAFIVAEIS